tara:strand:- start:944 stop:1852 length:909 start_codon:yes stop_codon:yes gene_type:complete
MDWLYLSLLAPLFLALNNIVDQFLSRSYFPNNNFLVLFTGGFIYLAILPCLYFFSTVELALPFEQTLPLIALGAFSMLMWVPYFMALADHEASMIMPILQLSPVFVFVIAYLFMGEVIGIENTIGAVLIIASSFLIVFDFSLKKVHLKPFILMLASAIFLSLQTIIFRYFIADYHWLVIVFWLGVGFCACGITLVLAIPSYRKQTFQAIIDTKGRVFALCAYQEISYLASYTMTIIALETAPSSGLVQTLTGVLPFYLVAFSLVGSKILPEQFEGFKSPFEFYWRMGCIAVMFVGLGLIYNQ